MYGRGYGGPPDRPPPGEFPPPYRQDQSMMRGRYEDTPPYPPQFPPQYESSAFHQHNSHYPSENFQYPPPGPPFWPHDGPPPPPPPFAPFYPPQHESGSYPPPHSVQYPPHHVSPSSSFGEHMHVPAVQQQGHTPPHIYSSEMHSRSAEFVRVSSYGEHDGRPLVDAFAHVQQRSSSFPHQTRSNKEDKPVVLSREAVLTNETSPPADVTLPNGQLVRIFCKHDRSFNLAVKDNRVLMVEADTEDEFQQWVRDDKYSIRVRDSYGHPAFMLINKGSKKALKHGMGKLEEVQLINYTPEIQDDDLFWTESQDFGEGFKTVRMASNTLLNLSVACGNNIENGSTLILDTWHKLNSQMWKIFPL